MSGTLDPILATAAVVLGLALVVQGVQQIFKQWLDLKSAYMRIQLLAMFDSTVRAKERTYHGIAPVTAMEKGADPLADAAVRGIEAAVRTFGYKDLEHLVHLSADDLKGLIHAIDWTRIPGAGAVMEEMGTLTAATDRWFDMAKTGFQDMYERRMKVWSFFTSLAVVIALNADLFAVYHEFTVNGPLRDAAVAWAGRSVQVPQEGADTSSGVTETGKAESILAELDSLQSLIGGEQFGAIGWRAGSFSPPGSKGWVGEWVMHVAGWFCMTILVSLGAPFWYDLLKTVLGIKQRVAGCGRESPCTAAPHLKPPEKPVVDELRPPVG